MNVLRRLKTVPDPVATVVLPSPREALAAVLATAAQHTEAAHRARAAVALAERMVAEAESQHINSLAAIEAARASHTAGIVAAAASGDAAPQGGAMREARQREVEAADDLTAARDALAIVREPLADLEAEERLAKEAVERAASAVLYAAVPDITRQALDAYEAFIAKCGVLQAAVEAVDGTQIRRFMIEPQEQVAIRIDAQKVYMGLVVNRDAYLVSEARGQEWNEAFAALLADASAPLPVADPG